MEKGTTAEHIPPKAFFPEDERLQLLTVRSCKKHNNGKSKNDLYVLAQICMNASPSNRAREIFMKKVAPQLSHNNNALRRMLAKRSFSVPGGGVVYPVDHARFDDFFTALSCGLVYKSQKSPLPLNYEIRHLYHKFTSNADAEEKAVAATIERLYGGKPLEALEFGNPETRNERIYTVEIFGVPGFQSSITIIHRFFGVFNVTSMLTRSSNPESGFRVDSET